MDAEMVRAVENLVANDPSLTFRQDGRVRRVCLSE